MKTDNEPRIARPGQAAPLGNLPDEAYYRRGDQTRRWGALLLLVGVVWLVFTLTARGPLMGIAFVERTQPIPPQAFSAERVVINGVNDRVELLPADGDEVVVEGLERGFGWNGGAAEAALEQLEVLMSERGDTLFIEVRRPSLAAVGRAPFAELSVALPAGIAVETSLISGDIGFEAVRGDLRLATVSGAVRGEESAGTLLVRTSSGDISLSDHEGALDVETTSGEVRADGELIDPRVVTVSGDVALEGATGRVEARTISGDLSVEEAEDARLTIESTSGDVSFEGTLAGDNAGTVSNISGDVRIRLDDADDLRLDLSTLSGDLETDLDLREVERERRSLRGTLGNGEGSLQVSTTSGDVAVSGD